MSQVSYTVGMLDANAAVVYTGTLEVQLDVSGGSATVQSGLLVADGFTPVLLSAPSGGGTAWNLSGASSTLAVNVTSIYSNVRAADGTPTHISGSIALTPAGQAEQNLLLLGYSGSGSAPQAPVLAQGEATAPRAATPGVTEYNLGLNLLDTSFRHAGSGGFAGTGQWVHVSPVTRQWYVRGTVSADAIPGGGADIQGWGSQPFWGGGGQAGDTSVTLSVVAENFIQNVSDGTLTVNGQTWFFVGAAVALKTVPISHLPGTPAAEPA